jgi:ankyrin repeat protein
MEATAEGHTPTVKLLLEAGANTEAKNEVREIE